MRTRHRAEWEWGWLAPLLLRFPHRAPEEIARFLATPLDALDLDAAETTFTARIAALRTSRIGIRFERVQEALFQSHPDTRSLRTGLVVPGRTEVDLLHRLHSLPQTVIHWEVAVKFYLGLDDGGSTDADRYIGPSLKDTLGIKMRAIFGRQLAILGDPAVRAACGPAFGIEPDDRILALPKVHGILFHPYRGRNELRRPDGVSDEGTRGVWVTVDRLSEFFASIPHAGEPRVRLLLDRNDWIRDSRRVPPRPEYECELKSWLNSGTESLVQSHFAGGGEPLQATILFTDPSVAEIRFFVVPTDWPNAADRGLETLRGESRIKA